LNLAVFVLLKNDSSRGIIFTLSRSTSALLPWAILTAYNLIPGGNTGLTRSMVTLIPGFARVIL